MASRAHTHTHRHTHSQKLKLSVRGFTKPCINIEMHPNRPTYSKQAILLLTPETIGSHLNLNAKENYVAVNQISVYIVEEKWQTHQRGISGSVNQKLYEIWATEIYCVSGSSPSDSCVVTRQSKDPLPPVVLSVHRSVAIIIGWNPGNPKWSGGKILATNKRRVSCPS